MSRICDICNRTALTGNSRSHARNATKRKQYINLQSKKIEGVKYKICSKCIKTLSKIK